MIAHHSFPFSSKHCLLLFLFEFAPNAQYLRYSPGLREATIGKMGRVTFEYLRNATKPRIAQVVLERLQQRKRDIRIAIDTIVCLDICTHEPGPHGSLVVSAIATSLVTTIVAMISRIAWTQGTQTVAGEERTTNCIYYRFRLSAIH